MTTHKHLSSEEICALIVDVPDGEFPEGVSECVVCEGEARSARALFAELRRDDAASNGATEWDDLLLRKRIREAVARETPHSISWFDRFAFVKPLLATATAIVFALLISNPASQWATRSSGAAHSPQKTLPSWVPLPDEADDEGLAVLAQWTPNADEIEIAGCDLVCLSGLTASEEEGTRPPITARLSRAASSAPSPL